MQAHLFNHLSITTTCLSAFSHSFIFTQPATSLLVLPRQKLTHTPTYCMFVHLHSIYMFIHLSDCHQSFPPKHLCPQPTHLTVPSAASSKRDQSKPEQGKHRWSKLSPYLEEDLGCHGEAVGDDGLLLRGAALPAVQLHAAAAAQQRLPVHLRRGNARELTSWRREAQHQLHSPATASAPTGAAETSAALQHVYGAD